MKKILLLLTPFVFLLALLLIIPAASAAPDSAPAPAPSAPAALIGGGQWDRIWRGSGALFDLDCATPDLCFAVGSDGIILKTEDHGQSWHQELLEGGQDLHGVSASERLVLAAGDGGVIYRSADAGLTWKNVNTPTGSNLEAVSLLADGNAWAVGAGGVILHSADGGQTWRAQTSNTPNPLHAVQFLNASTGYAAGEKGLLLKTTDGGATWTPVSNTFPGWARINALAFTDADTGWIAGQASYIRMTTDGGQTWQEIDSGVGVDIFSIHFGDGFGLFGGAKGVIATSTDGQSWTLRTSVVQDVRDVHGVFAAGADNSWAVGAQKDGGARGWFITHSSDGVGFSPVAGDYGAHPLLQDVATPDKDVAYVAGFDGAIGKTVDGGETWSWQHFQSKYENAADITAISCPTVASCWIAGHVYQNPGFVYVTHDGGQSWIFQSRNDYSNWPWMYDIEMLDAQNGHAAANPDMFHTSDGGVTWQKSAVVGHTANVDIAMASQYEGWTAQRNLGHRYTTSAGQKWERYMPYSEQANIYFFGVDTLDVNQDGGLDMGWLVGCQGPLVNEQCPAHSGVIFYAVGHQDPGQQQLLPPDTPPLHTITMLDDRHGWVGGADGTLLYTENGGAIWQRVPVETTNLITSIEFYKDKFGFAATYGGEILRFRGPGRELNSYAQSTDIVVDGEIDDWHYGGKLYLDADNASAVLGDAPYPAPEQLSGEFYSRWTGDALYLMAQIRDDVVAPGDAVRLSLDGLNDDVWDQANADDLLIFIAANGDFDAGSPENDAAIAHAVRRTSQGWQWEMRIPASLLGRSALAENDAVGLNLALDDSDGPGNSHSLLLAGRGLTTSSPATWGTIRLLGDALTLQNGLNDYQGAGDTYLNIWDNEPGNVVHGEDDIVKIVYTSGRSYANSLFRFDFSTLPEKASINNAALALYSPSAYIREGFQVAAYRLLRPWDEAAATWIMADAATPWAQGGALKAGEDYDPTPLDTVAVPVGFHNDWLSWDVGDAVDYWQQHPDENYGVILMGVNASQRLYAYSSDYNALAKQRPKLLVDFTLQARPSPTPTPTPPPVNMYLPLIQR